MRWDGVPEYDAATMPELSARQLADGLDCDVIACRLWTANWRNRIYRVTLDDGSEAVAKQACVGHGHELRHEFRSLRALARLPLGKTVRIPAPIAYLGELRTYLVEFVPGTPLDILTRRGHPRKLSEACQIAGRALGLIHKHWTREFREIPVDALGDDLSQLDVRFSKREKLALAAALENLRGHIVPVGQPYLDYKPANIIYDRGQIWAIDPPDKRHDDDLLLWDVAVFGRGLRHVIYPSVIRRSRWRLVRNCVHRFEQAYCRARPLALAPLPFRLLVDLMELQRLGQLIALQRSKCRRASLRHSGRPSITIRHLDLARFMAPLPVLTYQAHRLITRLNCALHA